MALVFALQHLKERGILKRIPIADHVAATSVGIVNGTPLLDLAYDEDSKAEVDMNVVMTGDGRFIEVQSTGEESTYSRAELDELVSLAEQGNAKLHAIQAAVLSGVE